MRTLSRLLFVAGTGLATLVTGVGAALAAQPVDPGNDPGGGSVPTVVQTITPSTGLSNASVALISALVFVVAIALTLALTQVGRTRHWHLPRHAGIA